jgi:hypothetical protein
MRWRLGKFELAIGSALRLQRSTPPQDIFTSVFIFGFLHGRRKPDGKILDRSCANDNGLKRILRNTVRAQIKFDTPSGGCRGCSRALGRRLRLYG